MELLVKPEMLTSYIYEPTFGKASNVIYIYGAPSKARNAKVVYIWTYVWTKLIEIRRRIISFLSASSTLFFLYSVLFVHLPSLRVKTVNYFNP